MFSPRVLPLILLSLNLVSGEDRPASVLIDVTDASNDDILDCDEEGIESCQLVNINFEAFDNQDRLQFPDGKVLTRGELYDMEDEGSYAYEYTDDEGNYAVLSHAFYFDYESLEGDMIFADSYYVLENCGEGCHILIKEKYKKVMPTEAGEFNRALLSDSELDTKTRVAIEMGRATDTVTDVSVIVYYTPKMKEVTSNIQTFVNNEIAKANLGFKNSKTNVNLKVHCIEEINLQEPADSQQRVDNFKAAKGSVSNLLNSADIAVLLTGTTVDLGYGYICGQVDAINIPRSNGPSVTWVAKNCGFTLGHEIGHLFGGRHNREADPTDQFVDYAHGFLIKGTKYLTLMSYENAEGGFTTPINYYSNIEQNKDGQPMGDAKNDVVRIIRETRVAMSKIGDESKTCSGSTPPPPKPVTTTTTTTTTTESSSSTCTNTDNDQDCELWKGQGDCATDSVWFDYMKAYCAKTCNQCQP